MDANYTLGEEEIQYLTLLCYYWGAASPAFHNQPNKNALEAWANVYAEYPHLTDDQIATYFSWSDEAYAIMSGFFSPFNETVMATQMLPFAEHPKSISATIIPLFVVLTVLSTLAIALRLWSRWSLLGKIQSFDWVALVSYFLIVAWGAYGVHASNVGGEWASFCDRSRNQIKQQSIAYSIGMTVYPMVVLSIKLALLLFYYQLSNWRFHRIAVWVTAFISIGNAVSGFFALLFQCDKVNFWDSEFDMTLDCKVDNHAVILATGIINIVTDALIWIIPMPLVWKLQLYPRERILAIFTFGLGGIACIAAAIRLKTVQDSITYADDGKDSILPIVAWGMIEINLALICSSAPALRALIMKHAPKILSYGSRSSGSEVKSIVNRSGGSRGGTSRAQGRIVIQYDSSAATEKHEEASVNEVEVGTPTSGARSPRRTDFV